MQVKKSLNPIPPTMREKKRYILFQIVGNGFTASDVQHAINSAVLSLYGSFGFARISPKLIEWSEENAIGIMKCERSSKDSAIVALQFIKDIKGKNVAINIIAVSGTIKALREKSLRAKSIEN